MARRVSEYLAGGSKEASRDSRSILLRNVKEVGIFKHFDRLVFRQTSGSDSGRQGGNFPEECYRLRTNLREPYRLERLLDMGDCKVMCYLFFQPADALDDLF